MRPVHVSRSRTLQRALLVLTLAALAGVHAWVFFTLRQKIEQGYPDFIAFYSVGKCLQRGLGTQLYDLTTQARVQEEFAPALGQRSKLFPWVHPPFEAIPLAPLARLSYAAAYWTWDAISVLALAGFVWVVRPFLPRLRSASRFLPWLCAFAFFPVFDCLVQGQDSILLLLLFGLAYSSLKRGREWRAGAWLGLGLFRFQLVLPLLAVLACRRKWKVVGGCAAVGAGLALVSAAVVGWRGLLSYPHAVLECNRMLQGAGVAWNKSMPNLRGVVDHFLGAGTAAGKTAIVAGSVAALGVAIWRGEGGRADFDLSFSLTVVVSVLISYYLFPHDLSLLLLPLLLAADWLCAPAASRTARGVLGAAVGLLFFSPLYFLLWLRYERLSALFWVVALLAAGLVMAQKRVRAPQLAQAAGR